jgi:hypothetical protein
LALQKSLTTQNIKQGFKGTGIWPLSPQALAGKMGPSELFHNVSLPGIHDFADDRSHPTFYDEMAESDGDKSDGEDEDEGQLDGGLPFDGGLEGEGGVGSPRLRGCTTAAEQYYVGRLEEPTVGAGARDCDQGASVDQDAEELALPQPQRAPPVVNVGFGSEGGQSSPPSSISRFLQLPEVQAGPSRRTTLEPLVDYTKSIIMTSDAYIKAMEDKAARKEVLEKEKQVKKREAELTKGRRAEEKLMKETAKKQRLADVRARRAFAEKWFAKAVAQAGENLHQLIKSGAPPPPGSYVGKFVTFCPEICLRNQAITMARLRAKREGRTPDPALVTTLPPWVHQPDPRFFIDSEVDCDMEAAEVRS